jgi:hypothetical protein
MNRVVDRFCGFVDLSSMDLDFRRFSARTSEGCRILRRFPFSVYLHYAATVLACMSTPSYGIIDVCINEPADRGKTKLPNGQ